MGRGGGGRRGGEGGGRDMVMSKSCLGKGCVGGGGKEGGARGGYGYVGKLFGQGLCWGF